MCKEGRLLQTADKWEKRQVEEGRFRAGYKGEIPEGRGDRDVEIKTTQRKAWDR